MNYSITVKKTVSKTLANLQNEDYQRVRDVIRGLAENPRPSGCLKLTGRDAWRVRIGNYRVIYEINDIEKKIIVIDLGHRRDIYR
ncbi:MAG: type II toxin-antitoxin system RelE/ParE family toxin [Pseudanabaenaceae cyanobacterium bins.39]|nr:type II toxin-antitoxin system RelE/ParE family toxin [Pseudanabaenaceae cyanobacterium bins.39]